MSVSKLSRGQKRKSHSEALCVVKTESKLEPTIFSIFIYCYLISVHRIKRNVCVQIVQRTKGKKSVRGSKDRT